MSAFERLSATIHGHVQGVGFRYFALTRARQLSLKGWVRNDADGTVHLVAEGTSSKITEFEEMLQQGPPVAHVEHVETSREEGTGEFRAFEIRN